MTQEVEGHQQQLFANRFNLTSITSLKYIISSLKHTAYMPLFGSSHAAPAPVESIQRSRSIFEFGGHSHSNPPTRDSASWTQTPTQMHPLSISDSVTNFFKHRPPSPSADKRSVESTSSSQSSSFFHLHLHHAQDPSVSTARQKVAEAENAEKAADRALLQAKAAAKAAKEHIKMLEREAREDAKRAKAKQAEAKSVSKTVRSLRHA
ncbi:hypothetical protein BJ138DRAFT_1115107 [Hygrophoropsis aurantiaca]|uniref:Uncharacterized protein n=1 Tax=Hygrophoropsis aurantiaca TaxID=72124 RepID=A0ACB8A898_9AGAM|nr:hypothetical protein BJ138DRAFT_1115107 [Hygrophoropsis aurantiaca]